METDQHRQWLDKVSAYCGIQAEFWDIFGHLHVASPETRRAIVASLGFRPDHLEEDLSARESARWSRLVDPCVVAHEGRFTLHLPESFQNENHTVEIAFEDGETSTYSLGLQDLPVVAAAEFQGKRYVRKEYISPVNFPLGYHDLTFTVPGLPPAAMHYIVAPTRAFIPEFLEHSGKTGGIAIALYGLRSARNWGCGDFRDLREFCEWAAAEAHVSFVALNPLHAIHNRAPYNTSPYLPNSIFYQNFIYLDVEAIDEFQYSPEAQQLFHDSSTQQELAELRAAETVHYERVHAVKLRFLKLAFEHSRHNPSPAFRDYVHKEGDLLLRFATFCALDEHLQAANPDLWIWADWPAPYQDPLSPETRKFQQEHAEAIAFFQWVQWQLDRQLSAAQEHAKLVGLAIGLYHDLALATDRFGSDLWAHRPFYVSGARVGSPPDDFSPQGQDWAFPPPNKYQHRDFCYQLFIESIRKTCRHGGALRIDHVMRFFRLYWIPDGSDATAGAYVSDFADDLIRILALESVRNQVLIIGEDLGTVEPEVRETLARFGILSYRLFYFEREESGAYKQAAQYPRQALVSSTTHDLPTIAGFWINQDIEARRQSGVLDNAGYQTQVASRAREKQKMLDVLFSSNLLPPSVPRDAALIPELTGELHNAIIGFLASTPSMLLVVNQEDLSKEAEQQNLPGTTWQHPNWSRKMKFTLEQLRSDPASAGFVEMFRHWLDRTGRSVTSQANADLPHAGG
jgi:4-alpha-glucanotransferase